jgi:hypothetical protein
VVVAIAALVFSVAGSGVASVATISALTKKEKRQTRKSPTPSSASWRPA